MTIEYIISLLKPFLGIYAYEGEAGNFWNDNERLERAQDNYEHLQKALEELNQIKEH